jgi:hypothetical protein
MSQSERFRRELDVVLRHHARRDRFGDAPCVCCGNTTLLHLNRLGDRAVCRCCLALLQGARSVLEGHHLAGRGEGPVVYVCRNCHLELTELQRSWSGGLLLEERLARGFAELSQVRRARSDA